MAIDDLPLPVVNFLYVIGVPWPPRSDRRYGHESLARPSLATSRASPARTRRLRPPRQTTVVRATKAPMPSEPPATSSADRVVRSGGGVLETETGAVADDGGRRADPGARIAVTAWKGLTRPWPVAGPVPPSAVAMILATTCCALSRG